MTDRATDSVFVEAPGGRLFARLWGADRLSSGPRPIVLVHDSLGSVELWRDFPARLATVTGHTVVAYDRLGFGRSDPHPAALEAPGFVHDEGRISLPALGSALGIERIVLFGHSVGGAMAIAAAAERPGSIVGVITEAAQVFAEERTLTAIRDAKAAFNAPGQLERLARYHGEKARWVLNAWTESWLDPAFASWNIETDLRRLRCPILAMHGDRDEYGSHLHPERIAALAPTSADVVMFEDCGHVPHREHPDAVLAAVLRFINERVCRREA